MQLIADMHRPAGPFISVPYFTSVLMHAAISAIIKLIDYEPFCMPIYDYVPLSSRRETEIVPSSSGTSLVEHISAT